MGHLCNATNYLYVKTEVGKSAAILLKIALPLPLPTQCNVENQVKLQVLLSTLYGVGGTVRQVKLYSHLACAQKRQKCKFDCRLLTMYLIIRLRARDFSHVIGDEGVTLQFHPQMLLIRPMRT